MMEKLLSPREREIAAHVVDERSRPWIAQQLGITVRTVDAHLERIADKLPPEALRRGGRLRVIRMFYAKVVDEIPSEEAPQ
jgi:FixJ family two-component response regulator